LPFVPAVVEDPTRSPGNEVEQRTSRLARRFGGAPGIVEVEIDGVIVRVGRGAEAKTIAAVIRALKAGS
jgi:transposase